MKFPDNSAHRVLPATAQPGPEKARAGGIGGARKSLGVSPLGIKRQFVDIASAGGEGREAPDRHSEHQKTKKQRLTPAQIAERRKLERRAKHADQREAARLMWQHNTDGRPGGVTLCGWTQQAMADAIEVVRVTKADTAPRSFLSGTAKCKLGWVCPICTGIKAEEARQKLNAVLSKGRRVGWKMVMMTLTVRHDKDMPLAWLWPRLSAASDDLRRSYAWKQINKHLVGSVKAVEATHGANGWHPHFHIVLVFREDSVVDQVEAEAMAEGLRSEWMTQLSAQGLNGTERAFQVQGAASAGNYLVKWGAAEEITLGHAKQGRKGQRSPWQLLRDSREGDFEAGHLWHGFVTVIKGTHQIRITPGLNREVKDELCRLELDRLEAIAAGKLKDEPEVHTTMARYDEPEEWMHRGRHRRVRMLEGAAARTRREAERAVWQARHGDQTDADLLRVVLIEDDKDPDFGMPAYDNPEPVIAAHRAKKVRDRRDRRRAFDADLDYIDDLQKSDRRCPAASETQIVDAPRREKIRPEATRPQGAQSPELQLTG